MATVVETSLARRGGDNQVLGAGGKPEAGAWHGAWEVLVRDQVATEDATDPAGCAAVLETARNAAAEKSSAR